MVVVTGERCETVELAAGKCAVVPEKLHDKDQAEGAPLSPPRSMVQKLEQSSSDESVIKAACCIQRAARKFIDRSLRVNRSNLILRLQLEKTLFHGIRLFLLFAFLFTGMLLVAFMEQYKDTHLELGLLQSYISMFNLHELDHIRTVGDATTWLKRASKASREAQITSSEYFVEDAEQRLLTGIHYFQEESLVSTADLRTDMLIHGFTFSVWLGPPDAGANPQRARSEQDLEKKTIIRRPLESAVPTLTNTPYSCWSWAVQGSDVLLDYGAHDHPYLTDVQEEVNLGTIPGLQQTPVFLALVVDALPASTLLHEAKLYVNGNLHKKQNLSRPLTDCDGRLLGIGGANMNIADLTFYPRALAEDEIRDALAFGLPLKAVIRGKASATKEASAADAILESQDQSSEMQRQGQSKLRVENAREEMLTRMALSISSSGDGSGSNGSSSQGQRSLPVFHDRPRDCAFCDDTSALSVRGMSIEEDDRRIDNVTGYSYVDLWPGRLEGFTDGGALRIPDVHMHLWTHNTTPNFSLSMWVQPDFDHMLISTFLMHYSVLYGGCWEILWDSTGKSMLVTAPTDEWEDLGLGTIDDWGLRGLARSEAMLRHLVFVQRAPPPPAVHREWTVYVDGVPVSERTMDHGRWEYCESLIFNGALGDPALGVGPYAGYKGVVQQWHLYETALSAPEVSALHDQSRDPDTGAPLRQCLTLADQDVTDSADVVDVAGHDCAWYFDASQQFPELCNLAGIPEKCPLACGRRKACWADAAGERNSLYGLLRITKFAQRNSSAFTTCWAQDALDELASQGQDCCAGTDDNCVSACSFNAPWRHNFTLAVNTSDSWSVTVWLRLSGDESETRQVRFFNSGTCNSKTLLLQLRITPAKEQLWAKVQVPKGEQETADAYQDINTYIKPGTFSSSSWTLVTVSVGPLVQPQDEFGLPQRYLSLTVNARSMIFPSSAPANLRNTTFNLQEGASLVDGVMIAGSMILGPIDFIPIALPPWAVQDYFYRYRSALEHRVGPSQPVTSEDPSVQYDLRAFRAPGLLLAPPLLLQSRRGRTTDCPSKAGTQALLNIAKLVQGQCSTRPYTCPGGSSRSDRGALNINEGSSNGDGASVASSALLACSSGGAQQQHFGRNATNVDGMNGLFFGEFLVTTAEATIVARSGHVYGTEDFIDGHSELVRLVMVVVAPDFQGRVSTISVFFEMKSQVEAHYQVEHFRALEKGSSQMTRYIVVTLLVMILAAVLLMDAVIRLLWPVARGRRWWPKKIVLFDIALAIAIVAEYGYAMDNNRRSSDDLVGHLNTLMLEERWSRDVSLEVKVSDFIKDIAKLEADIYTQTACRLAAMFLAALALWRLILATQTHPRMAILLDTLSRGWDALIHYIILLVLIFWSFVFLGILSFGGSHPEFGSLAAAIELLAKIMLQGEYPEGTLQQAPGYILYIMSCVVIFFFLMLNFVLAIVVDMYAKVQAALDELAVEQFVFLDVASIIRTTIIARYYSWPCHKEIIVGLQRHAAKSSCTVDSLETVSKEWDRGSRVRFMQHYKKYDFLAPQAPAPSEAEAIARETEQRIAVLLGIPPATEFDHALSKAKSFMATKQSLRARTATNDVDVPLETSPSVALPKAQAIVSVVPMMPGSQKERCAAGNKVAEVKPTVFSA